jgi:hypothetical protein
MSFFAECPFCSLKLRGVPEDRRGDSVECPRCHSFFTLAAMADPPKEAPAPLQSAALRESAPLQAAPVSSPPAEPARAPVLNFTPLPVPPAVEPAPTSLLARAPAPTRPPDVGNDDEDLDDALPPPPAAARRLGAVSLLVASVAVAAASVPHLGGLTAPLGGVGVVLGLLGLVARAWSGHPTRLPLAGLGVSLAVLLGARFVPALIGHRQPAAGGPAPVDAPVAAVPLRNPGTGRRAAVSESEWVEASRQAVVKGDIRVRIRSVAVTSVEGKDAAGRLFPPQASLVIGVRLVNVGVAHRVVYRSWADADRPAGQPAPRLTDHHGHRYELRPFAPGEEAVGHVRGAPLTPGQRADDILVFEPPGADVEYLRLELPAAAFGASGTLRWQIPRGMIKHE